MGSVVLWAYFLMVSWNIWHQTPCCSMDGITYFFRSTATASRSTCFDCYVVLQLAPTASFNAAIFPLLFLAATDMLVFWLRFAIRDGCSH